MEQHARAERAERSIAEMQEVQATWEQELVHMGQAHTEQVRLACTHPNSCQDAEYLLLGSWCCLQSLCNATTQACGVLKPEARPLSGLSLEDSAGCQGGGCS